MSYEDFRDKIAATIRTAGHPMTWTEIRTTASLPQMLPNNQWVRRMEGDIHLQRKRDPRGVILWSLGA